jgi:hypothetical protein
MTPEQRQYATGAIVVIGTIVIIAVMWFAFGVNE